MSEQTKVVTQNGVDVAAMGETIGAVKSQPGLAKFRLRASNKWINCGQNRTRIEGFYGAGEEHSHDKTFEHDADEPKPLLGHDKATSPGEYLLVALASCVSTSVVYHAAAKGIQIESLESTLEGNIDLHGFLGLSNEIPKGFEDITVKLKIKSDASKEQLEELANMSPIADTVTRPVPVKVDIQIV
ncbi:MAG: OsmC family protein [Candidatus Latescibacterota bacterium]|nr:MAG: OsmC family protein [Candidatus Latescibacterota bacterium]